MSARKNIFRGKNKNTWVGVLKVIKRYYRLERSKRKFILLSVCDNFSLLVFGLGKRKGATKEN